MINITNEDCMELMKRYPDKYFDLAIVDPPYGDFGTIERTGGSWANKIDGHKKIKTWDFKPEIKYFEVDNFFDPEIQEDMALCLFNEKNNDWPVFVGRIYFVEEGGPYHIHS